MFHVIVNSATAEVSSSMAMLNFSKTYRLAEAWDDLRHTLVEKGPLVAVRNCH
jgi:hypothetical protein